MSKGCGTAENEEGGTTRLEQVSMWVSLNKPPSSAVTPSTTSYSRHLSIRVSIVSQSSSALTLRDQQRMASTCQAATFACTWSATREHRQRAEYQVSCADSLSLREFRFLDIRDSVLGHSSLPRIRSRLPLNIHAQVIAFVLKVLAKTWLVLSGWLNDLIILQRNLWHPCLG